MIQKRYREKYIGIIEMLKQLIGYTILLLRQFYGILLLLSYIHSHFYLYHPFHIVTVLKRNSK